MTPSLLLLVLACASLPVQSRAVRGPHCTLAEGDLPYWLAIADPAFARAGPVPLLDGKARDLLEIHRELHDRHRHGHGSWPILVEPASSASRTSRWKCDESALAALVSAARQSTEDSGPLSHDATLLLEANGRMEEAAALYRAELRGGGAGAEVLSWTYAEFLVRWGKYEEALQLLERDQSTLVQCGFSAPLMELENFERIERCHRGLWGSTCDDDLFERRLRKLGIEGLAPYVGHRLAERGAVQPEAAALRWLEGVTCRPEWKQSERETLRARFRQELDAWSLERRLPRNQPLDTRDPSAVERAAIRARERAHEDPRAAHAMLAEAVESGLPVVGHAIRDLVADRSVKWSERERAVLVEDWRDALLMRTYGAADPEDPGTW